MVLLKGHSEKGFVFYTNLNSQKGNEIKENPNATMCFHWKSLLRQIRIVGTLKQVDDQTADEYFNLSCILLSPSNQNSIVEGVKFQPDQWLGLGTLSLSLYFFL